MSARRPATPDEAEAAFYAAFERQDIDAMMTLWLDDDTCCVHPLGPVLLGQAEIRRSWEAIFSNPQRMRFRLERRLEFGRADLAVHVVTEHIELLDAPHSRHTVFATNAYRLTATGWAMILHHASPAPGAPTDRSAATLH